MEIGLDIFKLDTLGQTKVQCLMISYDTCALIPLFLERR